MNRLRRQVWWLAAATMLVVASGCSTYARRVTGIRESFYRNDLSGAGKQIAEGLEKSGSDADLLKLEQAMIRLAEGKPAESERLLREVRDHFDASSGPSIAKTTLSYLTDDQRRAYSGEDYERILIRAFLALSNLMHDGGDAEAYTLQMIAEQERVIAEGTNDKGENPKANYQRVALAPYLRGALRESTHHDYDDAKRAFETVAVWQPDFAPARHDVERASFGHHSEKGQGVLYVFALTGRGPYKQEVVEVPSSAALLVAGEILSAVGDQTVPPNIAPVKVPRVVARPNSIQSISVQIDGHAVGQTATITNISQLAVQQYQAIETQVVGRAVARRLVKKGIVYGAKEATDMVKGSPLSLAVDLAGVAWEATESADTRCWGLLPDRIQVLRVELAAGAHELRLAPVARGVQGGATPPTKIEIGDGDNTYVLATFPGDHVVGRVLASRRGEPAEATPTVTQTSHRSAEPKGRKPGGPSRAR